MLIQLTSPSGDALYLQYDHITAIQETNTDRTSSYVYLGGGFALFVDGSPEEVLDDIKEQEGGGKPRQATVKPVASERPEALYPHYPQIGE